jgi:hypothetical protein
VGGEGQYFVFISECYLNGMSKLSWFGVENNIEKPVTLYGCQPPSTRDIPVRTSIYL